MKGRLGENGKYSPFHLRSLGYSPSFPLISPSPLPCFNATVAITIYPHVEQRVCGKAARHLGEVGLQFADPLSSLALLLATDR